MFEDIETPDMMGSSAALQFRLKLYDAVTQLIDAKEQAEYGHEWTDVERVLEQAAKLDEAAIATGATLMVTGDDGQELDVVLRRYLLAGPEGAARWGYLPVD